VLAAQLVSRGGMLGEQERGASERDNSSTPAAAPVSGGTLPKSGVGMPSLPPGGKR
jgi:hypothetical protein